MTATPWDDDRLDAAFAAVAAVHPTPGDLIPQTQSALANTGKRFAWGRLVAAAALVAVMVAVIGGVLLGSEDRHQTAASDPSGTATTATASSTPAPTTGGLGMPVLSVADALAIREGGIDDREIAIRGWYFTPGAIACPSTSTVSSLQLDCEDNFEWLTQEPEALSVTNANGSGTIRPPVGPALHPYLDALTGWVPDPSRLPAQVVMVGHFDDPGAAGCPAAAVQECRDRLVVTQVWSPDGQSLLSSEPSPSPPATSSPADAPLGLHVQSVAEAIAVRDAGVDDREIAVRGWFTDGQAAVCMTRSGRIVIHPLQLSCDDQFTWLMQDPEALTIPGSSSALPSPPIGPALNPDLDGLDRSWIPTPTETEPMPLTDVVMLGHFDDRRSATCPRTSVKECQDRFVVDRVWSVNGVRQPISNQAPDPVIAVPSFERVQSLIDAVVPGGQVLSVLTMRLRDLSWLEPSIEISAGTASPAASDPATIPSKLSDLPGAIVVSMIRVLEDGRVVTYVEQAQTGMWQIADDGSVDLVSGIHS